jgi:hypothetical protein
MLVLVPIVGSAAASAPAYVLLHEFSQTWLNVHDVLVWLPSESEDTVRFLWASETSGFRHLEVVTSRLMASNSTERR